MRSWIKLKSQTTITSINELQVTISTNYEAMIDINTDSTSETAFKSQVSISRDRGRGKSISRGRGRGERHGGQRDG